ncbi:MAG: hypothetical protein ACR2QE_08545 [Acidimicrobiales bacterium]
MASSDDAHLKRGTKVYAAEDLPGVPEGTPGKVLVSVGLTWIRYRVRFANGVELGTLDRSVLWSKQEWDTRAPVG